MAAGNVGATSPCAVVRLAGLRSNPRRPRVRRRWLKRTTRCCDLEVVPHIGFEPMISALRGRCPGPLDECGAVGAGWGRPGRFGMIAAGSGTIKRTPARRPARRPTLEPVGLQERPDPV